MCAEHTLMYILLSFSIKNIVFPIKQRELKLTTAATLLNNGNPCIMQLHTTCQPQSNCKNIVQQPSQHKYQFKEIVLKIATQKEYS